MTQPFTPNLVAPRGVSQGEETPLTPDVVSTGPTQPLTLCSQVHGDMPGRLAALFVKMTARVLHDTEHCGIHSLIYRSPVRVIRCYTFIPSKLNIRQILNSMHFRGSDGRLLDLFILSVTQTLSYQQSLQSLSSLS